MTDTGNSESRVEQAAARAEEILNAPSERLASATRRFVDVISDATRRAPLQSLGNCDCATAIASVAKMMPAIARAGLFQRASVC